MTVQENGDVFILRIEFAVYPYNVYGARRKALIGVLYDVSRFH